MCSIFCGDTILEVNTTYKINNMSVPPGTKCECGHSVEAHGSSGKICAGCRECKQFKEKDIA